MRGHRLKQRARRSESNEDWSEAAKQYRGALTADPADATSWYRLGRVLAKQKDWAASAFAIQSAIALRGGSAASYFHLGQSLQRAGAVSEARWAYQQSEAKRSIRPTVKGRPGELLSYQERLDLALMPKASYAYLLFRGASLAKRLGIRRITAVELGVAGGNGLLAMERHAMTTEKMTGIGIDVYGFDTGKGLVAPKDKRDLPYRFTEGTFAMDVEALTARLKRAELVLGDAVETFREFMATDPAPLGAVSFDMDLYAPTQGVLTSMTDHADEARFLPRVPVYFDDVVGNREQDYNVYTGELLAIEEFNQENPNTKLVEDRHFRTLPLNFDWHHSTYTMHRFGHPRYNTYIRKARPDSLALR
jgi:tetratricopeptide (TPR) repeat protein